jgi:nucleoside phosphorylase
MKVLIVEDDVEKLRRLAQVVIRGGVSEEHISAVQSSHQAKAAMRSTRFDLLLLDLNIPQRQFEDPVGGEGLKLLEEITERPKFCKPVHVIGVTAFDVEHRLAQPVFDAALVPIFRYDREADDWELPLQRRVEYLVETVSPVARASTGYDFDIAILTSLDRPELAAVLDLPWNWAETNFSDDDTSYHIGSFRTDRGSRRVVAAHCPFMGMPVASVIATKLIQRFRPRYLAHLGIAAAVRGQAEIGDVLVADPSWDWGSGKFVLEGEEVVFYAAPYQISLREEVRGYVRRIIADEESLSSIRSAWRGVKPPSVLSVKLGPVASGASVLADGIIKDRVRDQHRKVIGIEMETYGVLAAAEFATRPPPVGFSLKSACDFADGEKNDMFQSYAAFTAASVFALLARRYL